MATESSEDHIRNILVLPSIPLPKSEHGSFIRIFGELSVLHQHICAHVTNGNNFDLHISEKYIAELIESCIHEIQQVRRISIYCETDDSFQLIQNRFSSIINDFNKFDFHPERDLIKQLENAEGGEALDSFQSSYRSTTDSIAILKMERLYNKRRNSSDSHSSEPKRFAPNIHDNASQSIVHSRFICPSCRIFFQNPYQLECADRICESCLGTQTSCTICSKPIKKDKAWLDRGFRHELQQLPITCLECKWRGPFKLYQEHSEQFDQNRPISATQVIGQHHAD